MKGLSSLKATIDSSEPRIKVLLQEGYTTILELVNQQGRGDQEAIVFLLASQMLFHLDRKIDQVGHVYAPDVRLAKLVVKIWAKQNDCSKDLEHI